MQDKEFNLIKEPWVRVLRLDGKTEEVSLKKALLCAHEYRDLAGETSTQDVAVLRLLLAILHTVFSRVNSKGEPSPIQSERRARGRWKTLWQAGQFPEKPICDYLKKWHERFWLFHPERPFYQVLEAVIGTEYGAAKLNGEVLESSNKLRLFSVCAGTSKTKMSYEQAARWLLYINAYDDTAVKRKDESNRPQAEVGSVTVGWVGKLGVIIAQGNTLFETLLLNMVLLQDGEKLWKGENRPEWEKDAPETRQCIEIPHPNNAAELLTLQTRKLLLRREGEEVVGYYVMGGEKMQEENSFEESMTIWREVKGKGDKPSDWEPCPHHAEIQMWREFPLLLNDTESRQPGVVKWVSMLRQMEKNENVPIFGDRPIRYRSVGIKYKDGQPSAVEDTFSDTLTFHADLLTDLGRKWQGPIKEEIKKCEKTAVLLGHMAMELELAAGKRPRKDKDLEKFVVELDQKVWIGIGKSAEKARQNFYFEVDVPFRRWLQKIDPHMDAAQTDAAIETWRKQVKLLARQQAKEMVRKAGNAAFAGRTFTVKKIPYHYSSPEAFDRFLKYLNVIYKTA